MLMCMNKENVKTMARVMNNDKREKKNFLF